MTMTNSQQKKAAKGFAEEWQNRGYERGESQPFWISLLRDVFNVEHPEQYIKFEDRIKSDKTNYIDGYIAKTKVVIEQKSIGTNMNKEIRQSDGRKLTPFQQAQQYSYHLPSSQYPRWIVTCNFSEFYIYDMERPGEDPEIVELKDFERDYYRLSFLVDDKHIHIHREVEVSFQAGTIVGEIYNAFRKQYVSPDSPESLKSLNKLCVRLVFCLYAEDSGIFGRREMFHDYLASYKTEDMRDALIQLFHVLDQEEDKRDPYLKESLAEFPYVNGGLFRDEEIEIPQITDEIRDLLLVQASEQFDWSRISPTIFGAVFESTLNPETRRKGGMHYTTLENIHRVIDPLFLDDLKAELQSIEKIRKIVDRNKKLHAFQKKIASLTFFDPACGSGNFLTETYLSLRRLENRVLFDLGDTLKAGGTMYLSITEPIQVSIGQFYGIEINDFAVTVAKTALWIAESQMMQETENIVANHFDFLPLKTNANIVEGNSLELDWNSVIPKYELNYIMGNPPFVAKTGRTKAKDSSSAAMMSKQQKKDRKMLFGDNAGILDYAACWFKKASIFIQGSDIRVAFVATDSICQGQQAAPLWSDLLSKGVKINFAYRFFKWGSEASDSATVYVVIIGFSMHPTVPSVIYDGEQKIMATHISPYIIDAPNILVTTRSTPLCNVPEMSMGNQPIDNGNYLFTADEMKTFIQKEPQSKQYFKVWYDATGFLHNKKKYCLWLGDCDPMTLKKMPHCLERVRAVREARLKSSRKSTVRLAERPTHFQTENMPKGNYIAVPEISSGERRYIPMGFLDGNVLCNNKLRLVPGASLYNFGVMESNMHMAWMRAVGGYYGPSYQYSVNIVYNNFPWPSPTESQKKTIERTAQQILDARTKYSSCSLADLYGKDMYLFPELKAAHDRNNAAVLAAYGFSSKDKEYNNELACVIFLLNRYRELTKQ